MHAQPPRIAIGYTRVSTASQADHGHSLAAQSESIKGFCEKQGLELAHIYTDAGRSGSTMDGRPQLKAALQHAAQAKGVLVVPKLDRAARSVRDLSNMLHELAEKGAAFRVVDNPAIDTSSVYGRMVTSVVAAVAEMEQQMASIRTRETIQYKRSMGLVVAAPPYGYWNVGGRVVTQPQEHNTLQEIKIMHHQGMTARQIADALNSRNVLPRSGVRWWHSSVRSILKRYASPAHVD